MVIFVPSLPRTGHMRAFYTEDGVEAGAPDIALKSAKASALFQISSQELGQ